MDVGAVAAWATYFADLRGTPDASLRQLANDLYATYDVGVNFWTRPGGTNFNVSPPRRYTWEYKNSPSFSWALTGTDAPSQAGMFRFSSPSFSVVENQPVATITVTRVGGSAGQCERQLRNDNGTATAGSDYTATTGTLNFADGETSKTFTVPILNDTSVENLETVILTLSNPTGGASLSSPATATLSIDSDDTTSTPITATYQQGVNGYSGTTDADISNQYGGNGSTSVDGKPARCVSDHRHQRLHDRRADALQRSRHHDARRHERQRDKCNAHVDRRTFSANPTIRGYYLKSPWTTAPGTDLGWLRNGTGQNWAVPGALGQGTDVVAGKSFVVPGITGNGAQTITVNLDPAVVQSWIDNPDANQGILLVNETPGAVVRIDASENATTALRPKLSISYTVSSNASLAGDYNRNGSVDDGDYILWRTHAWTNRPDSVQPALMATEMALSTPMTTTSGDLISAINRRLLPARRIPRPRVHPTSESPGQATRRSLHWPLHQRHHSSGVGAIVAQKYQQDPNWWLSGEHLVDLDNDGDLDLFLDSHGGGNAVVALNDGHGVFTRVTTGTLPTTEIHEMVDINGDGKVDLTTTYQDGGGQWWINNSTPGNVNFTPTNVTRDGNTSRVAGPDRLQRRRQGRLAPLRAARTGRRLRRRHGRLHREQPHVRDSRHRLQRQRQLPAGRLRRRRQDRPARPHRRQLRRNRRQDRLLAQQRQPDLHRHHRQRRHSHERHHRQGGRRLRPGRRHRLHRHRKQDHAAGDLPERRPRRTSPRKPARSAAWPPARSITASGARRSRPTSTTTASPTSSWTASTTSKCFAAPAAATSPT